MFKKKKTANNSSHEGAHGDMVVGNVKSKKKLKPLKSRPAMIIPRAASGKLDKKKLIMVLAVFIALASILVLVIGSRIIDDREQPVEPRVEAPRQVTIAQPSEEEIRKDLDTVSVTGSVQQVSGDSLVVAVGDGSATFKITDGTTVFQGIEHDSRKVTDIKPGTQVTLSYSKATSEVSYVWFE